MEQIPNIFRYAKSELSQDAFLAWLCEWADNSHEGHTSGMHYAGRAFIGWLFERRGVPIPQYDSVEVKTQEAYIDVLVILTNSTGERRYILIEDKTYTSDYKEQISGYLKELTKRYELPDTSQVLTVYFKSSLEPRKQDEHLRLYLGDIDSFLKSLDRDRIKSEIFNSWSAARRHAFATHQRYLVTAMLEWTSDQWYGCFDRMAGLADLIGTEPDYDYVPKADFIAFTMGWRPLPSSWYSYIQIVAVPGNAPRLTFRLMAPVGEMVPGHRVRSAYAALQQAAVSMGKNIGYPDKARGGGKSACFALLDEPFMSTEAGMFDEALVKEQLLACQRMLEQATI